MSETSTTTSFNLRDLFGIALKRKWMIIIPVIISSAIAYGASYLLQPKYQSSTIIWIDKPASVSRELINLIGENRYRESRSDLHRELQALRNEIKSHVYIYQLIRDLKLDNDLDITRQATRLQESSPNFTLEELKKNILLNQLRSQIEVSFIGADQIKLTVEATDPVRARDIAMHLTEIMEEEKTKYELEKILDNQNFADLQLKKTEFQYRQVIDSLTEVQTRLTELNLPENISSESNRQEILTDIDRANLEIEDLKIRQNSLRSQLRNLDLDDSRLRFTDSLVEMRTEIEQQIITLASMMEKYAWDEQNIINVNIRLNDNIRLLEMEIKSQVQDQFASQSSDHRQLLTDYFVVKENLDVLNSKLNQLQLANSRMMERINQLPRLQAEIMELQLRVEEARRYRDAFKSEETTVEILSERARERTKYKVIEPARVPLQPFWPEKRKIVVMGFALGFIIGGALVLIRELTDSSFRRVEDVEKALGLPVIAVIPKIEKLKIR